VANGANATEIFTGQTGRARACPVFCFRIKFDSRAEPLIFNGTMAEIPPNNPLPGAPTGAEPMKKSTGKVQPKKETVRINLPPKPTAAPTIKLPTLPPGGPTGAPSPVTASAPIAPPPGSAPALKTALPTGNQPKTAAAPTAGAAPVAAHKPAPMTRPAAAAAAPSIKALDKILIFSAAFASLVAVGGVVWVFLTLQKIVQDFSS
jgi:hypothetical protein